MKNTYQDFFKQAQSARKASPTQRKPIDMDLLRKKLKQQNPKRNRRPVPWLSLILGPFILFGIGYGLYDYESIAKLYDRVEISFVGKVQAQEKPAEKPVDKSEAVAAAPVVTPPTSEIDHLMKLTERKNALDSREEDLARMELEIQKQREDLDTKIKSLEETRANISTVLNERAVKDMEKVEALTQMYSNMKPGQAAKVLESVDEDLAVEVLGKMKKKNAAEIMNLMKSEKAQIFSEKFAGYRKR
jgi:flagellar motility protein MotE (MotC chaperone)